MRKDEFHIVDQVRRQDMDKLIELFADEMAKVTYEEAQGIKLCADIVKLYREGIGAKK